MGGFYLFFVFCFLFFSRKSNSKHGLKSQNIQQQKTSTERKIYQIQTFMFSPQTMSPSIQESVFQKNLN
eukprot:m.28807 g.28807  ORF g.28807 m.28807 type:complete len:69 (-) comp15987_c0_seq2:8-214(-)